MAALALPAMDFKARGQDKSRPYNNHIAHPYRTGYLLGDHFVTLSWGWC